MKKTVVNKEFDVVVVGGGMSGVCAALASARHGAKTVLIQNRPMLGGNASSEVRMHICGADFSGKRPGARETGIVEEILLENKRINEFHSFSIFDTVLWQKLKYQENVELMLNTHVTSLQMNDNNIVSVEAEQLTTEKIFNIKGKVFCDCTGDATLAFLAGAECLTGREGKDVFGEELAPDKSDNYMMGSSLMFKAKDVGRPVKFEKPVWANTYKEEDIKEYHDEVSSGYWWIELGGDGELDTISDAEEIRDELEKAVYGVWDHLKNGGDHGAENYVLDWVQILPGKRDSRRIIGDYVLKEQDLRSGIVFDDTIAYGGWPIDVHETGGLRNKDHKPRHLILTDEVYTIPYRCLYSKNISNLMAGGRAISASHIAFGSTRVMATTSIIGQAIGTACAMQIEKGISPREVLNYIEELQRQLIKDDCYLPGVKNVDSADMAKASTITCSSAVNGASGENVINGYQRNIKGVINCWTFDGISANGEWIALNFKNKIQPNEVVINFDSNICSDISITLSQRRISKQEPSLPSTLVKDYSIKFFNAGELIHEKTVTGNRLRHTVYKPECSFECDEIKVTVFSTYGVKNASIFEIKVY